MKNSNLFSKVKDWVGRQLSRGVSAQLWIFLGAATVGLILATLLSGGDLGLGFANMVNSGRMGSALREGGSLPEKLKLVLLFFVGTVIFSGLLIATLTNAIRSYGERYLEGTIRSHWHGHILYLGYDPLMIGTLRHSVEEARRKGTVVVVAVAGDVRQVRNELSSHFDRSQMKRLYVMKANRTNADGLLGAGVTKAYKVFIIGHPDEQTHDAINLRALGLMAGLCIAAGSLPRCLLYIRNRATMSLFGRQGFQSDDLYADARSVIPEEKLADDEVKTRLGVFVGNYLTPINFYEAIAGNLLCSMDPALATMKLDWHNEKNNLAARPGRMLNLIIVGMSDMGMALARETLLLAHYPGGTKTYGSKLKITFVDSHAHDEMLYFMGRAKEFFRCCNVAFRDVEGRMAPMQMNAEHDILDVSFEFIQGGLAHPEVTALMEERASDKNVMLTIAMCTDDSPKNMAMALYLPRTLLDKGADVPVWVYQNGDGSLHSFMRHYMYGNLHTFTPGEYGDADLPESVEYEWARWLNAVHEAYYSGNGGYDPGETEIVESWKRQSLSNILSTINNVRSFVIKLRSIGWLLTSDGKHLVLRRAGSMDKEGFLDIDDQIQNLAEVEHTRWNIEKLLAGYKSTESWDHEMIVRELDDCRAAGLNETHRKIFEEKRANFEHDDIRPYADLKEYIQNKDVNMLRALARMVNRELKPAQQ